MSAASAAAGASAGDCCRSLERYLRSDWDEDLPRACAAEEADEDMLYIYISWGYYIHDISLCMNIDCIYIYIHTNVNRIELKRRYENNGNQKIYIFNSENMI